MRTDAKDRVSKPAGWAARSRATHRASVIFQTRLSVVVLLSCAVTVSSVSTAEGVKVPHGPLYAPVEAAFNPTWRGGGARRHDGLYLRAAEGFGLLHIARETQMRDDVTPPSNNATHLGSSFWFELSFGGTLASGVVLAGTGIFLGAPPGVLEDAPGVPARFGSFYVGMLGLTLDWFPHAERGFHAFSTLGLAGAAAGIDAASTAARGIGPAISLGVGWDAWIRNQWALGVTLRMVGARLSRGGTDDDALVERIGLSSVGVGLSLVHH